MGKIKCPVLLIVGEDDQNWPSTESAADVSPNVTANLFTFINKRHVIKLKLMFPKMKKMMEKAGNSHLLTLLSYPGAGHLIGVPYSPHARFSEFKLLEAKTKGESPIHTNTQQKKISAISHDFSYIVHRKKCCDFNQFD